jgi:hypothetical protein
MDRLISVSAENFGFGQTPPKPNGRNQNYTQKPDSDIARAAVIKITAETGCAARSITESDVCLCKVRPNQNPPKPKSE